MNTNDSFNQTKTVTARIVSVHKNRFQIALDSAERKAAEHDAVLAGRLLYRGEIPVVGDYIEAEFETSPVGKPVGDARIVSILPRKSLITKTETITKETAIEFPNIGSEKNIYIETSTNRTYRWSDTDLKYYCVGSDYSEIDIISGGKARG